MMFTITICEGRGKEKNYSLFLRFAFMLHLLVAACKIMILLLNCYLHIIYIIILH